MKRKFLLNCLLKLFAVDVVSDVNIVVACKTEYDGGTAWHRWYVICTVG